MRPDAIIEWLPRLRRYARALTGSAAEADDLVQATVLRAVEKFSLWQADSDLRAWLFTLMHHEFINQARRVRVELDPSVDPAELAAYPTADEARIDIKRCLQRLPTEQRAVLLLVGLEELSYAEAAQVLGVPQGTVMSRLSRARQQMAHLMADVVPPTSHLNLVK